MNLLNGYIQIIINLLIRKYINLKSYNFLMDCHFNLHNNSNIYYDKCNLKYKDIANRNISDYFTRKT